MGDNSLNREMLQVANRQLYIYQSTHTHRSWCLTETSLNLRVEWPLFVLHPEVQWALIRVVPPPN